MNSALIDRPKPQDSPTAARWLSADRLQSPLAFSLLSALLLWAALPPVNLWPLGWLAPVPLLLLVERQTLVGRRPYLQIWLGGFAFWLAAVYWLTLPHPATALGWLALSFYLAFYWPLFVGLTRVARWRWQVSPLLAAPIVYLGLELARDHLMTGFMMTGLGNSQYRWTTLIQAADLAGVNGISALIVFVAACVARCWPATGRRWSLWPLAPAVATLAILLGYGSWRLSQSTTRPGPTVALIQGSIDITMKMDPQQMDRILGEYVGLTRQALDRGEKPDLIVWPETMFRYPWLTFTEDFTPPADENWTPADMHASSLRAIHDVTAWMRTPIVLGIDTIHHTSQGIQRYNSALLVDTQSTPGPRYDKVHRVTFGEYVPFAETFPWLYRLTPLPTGLNRGSGPAALAVGGITYSPDICFESTVSRLMRGQVNTLRAEGHEPDVLLNLTNDGWFWGSSELEQHLACEVFRAIECRKPFLIAANTGISAWIDSVGRVVEQGPRRETAVIIAHPQLDSRRSPYLIVGDWPAALCLLACLGLAFSGRKKRNVATA